MKGKFKLLFAAITFVTATAAHATGEGFYIGLQIGQSNVHAPQQTFTYPNGASVTVTPSSTGFGVRALGGYNFRPWIAGEMGLAGYYPATYKINENTGYTSPTYVLDFSAKGLVPIWVVSFYGKVGMSIVRMQGLKNEVYLDPHGGTHFQKGSVSVAFRPIIGAGISYDMTPQAVFDLSWTRVLKGSKNPNLDFKSIGFTYHFVDVYCGQFLC